MPIINKLNNIQKSPHSKEYFVLNPNDYSHKFDGNYEEFVKEISHKLSKYVPNNIIINPTSVYDADSGGVEYYIHICPKSGFLPSVQISFDFNNASVKIMHATLDIDTNSSMLLADPDIETKLISDVLKIISTWR